MTATTAADVRMSFGRAVSAAKAVGIDSTRWALSEGSATYGRAYRLHQVDPTTGAHSNPAGLWDSFLGMTRRETIARLDGMRAAWLATADQHSDDLVTVYAGLGA